MAYSFERRKETPMPNVKSRWLRTFEMFFILLLLLSIFVNVVMSAEYPIKFIRLVTPFPPGGGSDNVARIIAAKLSDRLGKQVIVDNRGGAGGTIGASVAASSAPDGYTLFLAAASYVINNCTYAKLPYDPAKAFVPVAKFVEGMNVLSVYPGLSVNSVKELIALAKKQPGKLMYSAAGVGSFGHLAAELFMMMANIDVLAVQFKGAGPGLIDTMGGHTQIRLGSIVETLPHLQSGRLKPLGVGGRKRSLILPDIPTIDEAGVPGYDANTWWGILVPTGTPQAIVDKLNKEIGVILASGETKKTFFSQGVEVDYMGPVEFATFLSAETVKWGAVVKRVGVRAE
jgi:tripartite-type tricarboxylate transporter receptor subunit TctC